MTISDYDIRLDMVFNPPKKQVNVRRLMVYSLVPFLNAYAAWRVQSFWVILAVGYGITVAIALLVIIIAPLINPNPSEIGGSQEALSWISVVALFGAMFGSHIILQRHFSMKYNKKLASEGIVQ